MGELHRKNYRFERRNPTYFNACSIGRGSTFSTFVKLNQSYENTCFVFDHRADTRRLPRLPIAEEGRGVNVHERNDDPWNVNPWRVHNGQEVLDYEEVFDFDFDRSVAVGFAEEEHEEEGRS
jgi:hypothetical protein